PPFPNAFARSCCSVWGCARNTSMSVRVVALEGDGRMFGRLFVPGRLDSDGRAVLHPAKQPKRKRRKPRNSHQPLTDQQQCSSVGGKEAVGRSVTAEMLDVQYLGGLHFHHFHGRTIGSRSRSRSDRPEE